ncbi:MAG TPA: HAD-IIB family hydrolase [Nitrososphaera sp.]|jgi:HAD superfamily hydrolase (TIGR01484 family)|nr:HAD-IIB family hydrolase [Nitrososphaera sp.]
MSNRPGVKVFAIISDYDGTLCPAGDMRIEGRNRIPPALEGMLQETSTRIPVCILSSKDYGFLYDKVPFASIISCIMGIETLVMSDVRIIKSRHLLVDEELICSNANALNQLIDDVSAKFADIAVERKLTHDGFLAGVTFDWRNHGDWKSYSDSVTGYVKEAASGEHYRQLYVQTYSSHPFVDVYAAKCNKGSGFDRIASELGYSKTKGAILYLGDSENDNPAFARAGISIGVRSDDRLRPRLDCQYTIDFGRLAAFLQQLRDSDFEFKESLLAS